MPAPRLSASSPRARLNKGDGWYRFCRPYLEELNPRDDLDLPAYAREMVARAKGFKADTLVMMADDGGYPLYPSALAPINTHLHGEDLLGMIERECRHQGLRFGLGYLGVHCNSYAAATRPEWAMRDSAGQPYPFFQWHLNCLNSPFGRLCVELIGEALARYPVDYLYVEGEYFRTAGCFCAFCEERFRHESGRKLTQATAVERQAFVNRSVTAFQAAVKTVADAVSPETVVVGTSYRGSCNTGCDLATFPAQTDMMAIENQWGIGEQRSLHEAGLDVLQLRALSGKPVVGTWWVSHNVDLNYHQRSPAHAKLTFLQTLAYGAAVQPHIQTAFDFERSLVPTLTELFGCVERVREYLVDARLPPYLAVVDGSSAMGYCHALLEAHLPFDLVAPGDLDPLRLAGHRAVLVGDTAALSDSAFKALAAFVGAGGGLVCAGRLGARAAELAGLAPAGDIDSGREGLPLYYRFEPDAEPWRAWQGRLLSLGPRCARVRPAPDCRIEARVIGLDAGRMHPDHMGIKPYPGAPQGPMLVTRPVGRGRILYLAADLAARALPGKILDADVMRVLAVAAVWAAGEPPPISTNAPPSVELVTYTKPARRAIFILNQTMNQVESDGVIRYVVPVPEIEISLQVDGPVRAVTAVTGQPVRYAVQGGWLAMRLPRVAEYEVLLVDLAQ